MSDGTDSGKGGRGGGGGLFASIGRLFGSGSAGDRREEPEHDPAHDPANEPERPAAPGPAADAGSDDDEEEPLVLGPAHKAVPGGDGESGPRPGEAEGGGSDSELTLKGAAGANSPEDELTLFAGDAERSGKGDDATAPQNGIEEEEALIARMRERLGEGAGEHDNGDKDTGVNDTEENHGTPPESDEAGATGPSAAAPLPEEDGESAPSRLSGEDRGDGEGTFPAGDAWPNGREPMEGEDMDRKDETEAGDETTTPEAEEPAVALFSGAARDAATPDAGVDDAGDDAATDELQGPREDSAETVDITAERDPEVEAAGTETTEIGEPEPAEPADTAGPGAAFGSRDPGEEGDDGSEAVLAEAPGEDSAEGGGDAAAVEETVRRLIREEMEGELGERLSRNIRRMIREEVAHALLRNR